MEPVQVSQKSLISERATCILGAIQGRDARATPANCTTAFLDTAFRWLLWFPVFYLSFSLTVLSRRN